MRFTILSVILLLSFGLMVYYHARKGYKTGMTRSAIRLGAFLAAALFASALSVWLAYPVSKWIFNAEEIVDLLYEEIGGIAVSPALINAVLRLGVSALLFLPLVYLLNSLLKFIFNRCYNAAMGKRALSKSPYLSEAAPYYEKRQNVIGACIGAFTAVLMLIVSLTPTIGLINTTQKALYLVEQYVETEGETDQARNYVEFFGKDAVLVSLSACGSEALFDMSARTYYNGKRFSLSGEIAALERVNAKKVLRSIEGLGFSTDEDIDAILGIVEEVEKSTVLRSMMVSVVQSATKTWLKGEAFLGVEKPLLSDNEYIEEFEDEILYICTTTTEKTIDADVTTLANLYQIFNEYRAMFSSEDFNAMMRAMVESGMEEEIREEIAKNPHMEPLIPALEEMFLSLLSGELMEGIAFTEAEKQAIFEGITDILNDTLGLENDERVQQFISEATEMLEERGLYVPEDMAQIVAEKMIHAFPDYRYVTEQDIQAFFSEYLKQK